MQYKKQIAGIISAVVLFVPSVYPLAQEGSYETNTVKNVYNAAGHVTGAARSLAMEPAKIELPAGRYVLDAKIADVTGDAIEDNIFLIGRKAKPDAIYADQIDIIVQNGATGNQVSTQLENFGGYEAKLFVGDFDGDKISDVMVSAPTGGSGGIVGHVIATFSGAEPKVIFAEKNNGGAKFTGRFVDGFKAELVNENTGRSTIVDLSANKDRYLGSNVYSPEGKLLKEVKPYSYPFSVIEPIDFSRNGTYELRGHQRVVGAYNADLVANVTSIWKYEDNEWRIKQIEVATVLLSMNEQGN